MNNPLDPNAVVDVVRSMLSEMLVMEADEIEPESRLIDDLDADSLDLVDLNYRLGKRFGCALPKTSVIDHANELSGNPSLFVEKGGLTETGKALLEQGLNRYKPEQLRVGMRPVEVFSGTTVQNWANQIMEIFDQLPDTCPDCGHDHAVLDANGLVVCGSCSARLPVPDGDTASRVRVNAYLEGLSLPLKA